MSIRLSSATHGVGDAGVLIPSGAVGLAGSLCMPRGAVGVVLFAHGSGSSRHSPRNQFVARCLQQDGIGTLLFDLLTREEEIAEEHTRHLRFDIPLLTARLVDATKWIAALPETRDAGVGYFGASTGAAAALCAAAELGGLVQAVVARGGRPDLSGAALPRVTAATLLIVGEWDDPVVAMNEQAFARLHCHRRLAIVPQATHLFEEPGALEQVAELAGAWFAKHLARRTPKQ